MTKRRHSQTAYDESGVPVESAPEVPSERKTRSTKTWTIQGITKDGTSCEVVAEGMTRGQAEKMIGTSAPLLRKLYRAVRLVKTTIGEHYDL